VKPTAAQPPSAAPARPAIADPVLEVENLSIEFGGVRAVRDCSFSVARGSITALIGPNGAGKTTAFNMITGLLRPSAGSIRFDGVELVGKRPHQITRAGIGRTFQVTRELGEMTVLENVVVQAPARGLRSLIGGGMLAHEEERARELLDFVGLTRVIDQPAKTLSYGQKKLLELAGALMAEPKMIMLDEPAGGVNPRLLEDITARIVELNEQGVTFLIVEHNMDLIMSLSHSVVVMAHGQVLMQDVPAVVQEDDAVLDAYLGMA
jgi:branched-chain amino acid transport system ATP-binding protein